MSTPMYDFDPTMSNAANQVKGEQHVITSVNFRDYHYIIPKYAPLFAESLSIKMQYPNGTTRPMVEGKDYYLGFQFMDASATTDHPVYSAISFLDTDTEGVLTIDYHTVGGMWTLTPQQILQILANNLRNPRITSWEQVVNPPERFPPINHPHDIVDFKTMSDVQLAVDRVRDAILANSGGGLAAHIGNFGNPHNVTKAQVGLANVQNYAIATTVEAQAGTSNVKYMTPLRVKEAIDVLAANLVNAHTARTDNPHAVTKLQVGLGSVQNYAIATAAEAIAGVVNDKYMTPLRVMDVLSLTKTSLTNHMADYDNPHRVTKDHVGLFNVLNYSIATQEEARAGDRNDRYMSPLRTTQLVSEYVFTAMKSHSDRTDNPHAVSKQQVGLGNVQDFPIATLAEAQAGVRNDRYVTPFLVKQSIGAISGDLGAHATDINNPHQTTKAQVGLSAVQNYGVANAVDATTATSNILYMTPVRVREAIDFLVGGKIDAHIADINNPHGTTKAQVGLGSVQNYAIATTVEAQAGTSNALYMTPVRVKEAIDNALGGAGGLVGHVIDTNNPHNTTKAQVGLGNVQDYGIATTAQTLAGAANNLYLTPASLSSLRSQINTDLNGHAGRTDNPHSVTAAQVGAYNQTEVNTLLTSYLKKVDTAPNSILWNGRTEHDYGNWLNDQSGIAINAATLGGLNSQQLTDNVLSRVGSSFANQLKMLRSGDDTNPAEVATQYWVKIHELTYANMYAGSSRDGIAFITGGATSKAGADWTVGQNAIMLRTSARAVQAGGQLVECSTMTPTDIGSTMRVGYVLDATNKKITTYVQTRYDASDIVVTELSNPSAIVGDDPNGISTTAPVGIVYVTPRNLFTETAAVTATANAAGTAAGSAQTTANTAVSKADAAQSTANTGVVNAGNAQVTANAANVTANNALALAGTANATANQNKTDLTAVTARVTAIEALLNGITVS